VPTGQKAPAPAKDSSIPKPDFYLGQESGERDEDTEALEDEE
jgi:hypothetical protein